MLKLLDPTAPYKHERYKLGWIDCTIRSILDSLADMADLGIPRLNVGMELASFLKDRQKSKYLHLDVQEYIKKVFVQQANLRDNFYPPTLATYNLGILFEPLLQLDPSLIIKDLSKEIGIIILWDGIVQNDKIFHWGELSKDYYLNFSDTNIYKLDFQHEVQ